MTELGIIIVIFALGLGAMFIELFMPGFILGLMGLLAAAGSVIFAFAQGHTTAGVIMAVIGVLWVPLFFVMWKSVVGRFMTIKGDQRDYRPSTTIGGELVGLEGEAISMLRPSGIARLGDRRYDVVTRGEMLQKGARIKVIEVSGNRIVVKET